MEHIDLTLESMFAGDFDQRLLPEKYRNISNNGTAFSVDNNNATMRRIVSDAMLAEESFAIEDRYHVEYPTEEEIESYYAQMHWNDCYVCGRKIENANWATDTIIGDSRIECDKCFNKEKRLELVTEEDI